MFAGRYDIPKLRVKIFQIFAGRRCAVLLFNLLEDDMWWGINQETRVDLLRCYVTDIQRFQPYSLKGLFQAWLDGGC